MSRTLALINGRLPSCVLAIVISYFGRHTNTNYEMAQDGQYGDCQNSPKFINSILTGACAGGHLDIIDLAIANGANYWNYGMVEACHYGHAEIVEYLLTLGANHINQGLVFAYYHGHMKIVDILVAHGADILGYVIANKESLGDLYILP